MKKLTENIALFTIVALALSLYKTAMYYKQFNVNIVDYIDASEILQIQFFPLLLLLYSVAFVLMVFIAVLPSKIKLLEEDAFNKYLREFDNFTLFKLFAPLVSSFIMLFIVVGATSANTGRDVRRNIDTDKATIILDNRAIVTNDTIVFIGKTRNYIFLFDRKNNESVIFKMEDVKEFKIKNRYGVPQFK